MSPGNRIFLTKIFEVPIRVGTAPLPPVRGSWNQARAAQPRGDPSGPVASTCHNLSA